MGMKEFCYLFTLKLISSDILFDFEDEWQEADVVSYIEWLVHINLIAVLLQGFLRDGFQQDTVFFLAQSLPERHRVYIRVAFFLTLFLIHFNKQNPCQKCLLHV